MARALLINPSYQDTYGSSKTGIVNPIYPTLGLLTIAASAEQRGHHIEVLDLSSERYDYRLVEERVRAFRPDVVGVTATTPLMNQMRDISVLVKAISAGIIMVAGGPHISALPLESLQESRLDVAVVGEGELTFAELMDGRPLGHIRGIHFRDGDRIRATAPRPFVQNLDDLPMPAWHLYDAAAYKYKVSRLLARRRPLAMAEFSRGCIYQCDFCASKLSTGRGYRKKSPERCAAEVRLLHQLGYREFQLADDIFTTDRKWAMAVCEAIIASGVDMAWSCMNGIRVESAEEELFRRMRRAGCYRVSFGFESGNDEVLETAGKGGQATVERARQAVALARSAGIETNGYFLLGLSTDTEASMRDTIKLARALPLDSMKFSVAVAFPGTAMFKAYHQTGLVRSYDWDDYSIYTPRPLFVHERISFEAIQRCMRDAYRRAVTLNPRFILRRLWRGIRTFELFIDAYYFFRFMRATAVNADARSARYFAPGRWPTHDFERGAVSYAEVRTARQRPST